MKAQLKHLFFFSLLLSTTYAQDCSSIVTDRPDQTESYTTIYPSGLQIESGFTFQSLQSADGTDVIGEVYSLNSLWRLGVGERLELRLVTQPEFQRGAVSVSAPTQRGGIADLQVGFKLNLLQPGDLHTGVGVISHLVMPTGSEHISSQHYSLINRLAVTHFLSDSHSLAYNLGVDLGNSSWGGFYSLAWGIGLSDRLGIYLEPYGSFENLEDLSTLQANVDAGFVYLVQQNLQFDYSFGVGTNHNMNYHSVGFSIRLPE